MPLSADPPRPTPSRSISFSATSSILNERLGLRIQPTELPGRHPSAPGGAALDVAGAMRSRGEDMPFWIIVAGGKRDYTIKWWDVRRWQRWWIISGANPVRAGGGGGAPPPAAGGVIDLRGRTDLRQLVRLVYHAQGVVCPVTSLMHLAAAVPVKAARPSGPQTPVGGSRHPAPKNRPCVVVAGGREPPHWEAYPHHQFIHTNGQLLCCDHGGCWKARTVPLGDGDEKDAAGQLCVDVVETGPSADSRTLNPQPSTSAARGHGGTFHQSPITSHDTRRPPPLHGYDHGAGGHPAD